MSHKSCGKSFAQLSFTVLVGANGNPLKSRKQFEIKMMSDIERNVIETVEKLNKEKVRICIQVCSKYGLRKN